MLDEISVLGGKYVDIVGYGTVLNLLWLRCFYFHSLHHFWRLSVFQTESNGEAAANGSTVASDKKTD